MVKSTNGTHTSTMKYINRWTFTVSAFLSSVFPFLFVSTALSPVAFRLSTSRYVNRHSSLSSTALYVSPNKDNNFPNRDELSRQKAEVLEAVSNFHDGTWVCKDGALSFSISTDVAAGITAKRISVPYTTSVSLRVGPSADYKMQSESPNIRMMETFSWNTTTAVAASSSCCVAVRTVPWSPSVDVDSVDSSYSLDILAHSQPTPTSLLPGVISGHTAPTDCVFFIEKALALSNQERIRVFMLYEEDEYMMNPSQTILKTGGEMNCKLTRVVLCHESQEDDSPITMEQTKDPFHILEPVSMFTLSLGTWLGDLVVRDQSIHSMNIGFAEWMIGVQKVAMKFEYDFESTVKNYIDYGRALGVSAHNQMPLYSKGMMNENAMSRRIPPRERVIYIDYDSGSYAAFLLGSVYVKAPRFITFAKDSVQVRSDAGQPHKHTEFIAFHRDQNAVPSGNNKPELFCSRMTRLYDPQGRFFQGSTSFFTLQPNNEN